MSVRKEIKMTGKEKARFPTEAEFEEEMARTNTRIKEAFRNKGSLLLDLNSANLMIKELEDEIKTLTVISEMQVKQIVEFADEIDDLRAELEYMKVEDDDGL